MICGAPSTTACTESSHPCRMSRLWNRNASAMSLSRSCASSLSIAIGSSLRLAEVITRACTRGSANSKCWSGAYGRYTPSHGIPGATDGATPLPARARASTMGRAEVCIRASSSRVSSHNARAPSMSRTMTATGLPYRCFRSRRCLTAVSLVASTAR